MKDRVGVISSYLWPRNGPYCTVLAAALKTPHILMKLQVEP